MANKAARDRQRLFDRFVQQPGHQEMTQGKYFICPLCARGFERSAASGEKPELTLAHIIPKSLGGTWTTLACANCNSGNGHEIETELLASLKLSDWEEGRGEIEVRMGESKKVRATLRRDSTKGMLFNVETPMVNPAVGELKEFLKGMKEGSKFNFSFTMFRPERCWAAICQSAYLLLFKYFGYDFARLTTYQDLRKQSLEPKERIWNGQIFVLEEEKAEKLLNGNQAAVVLASGPVRAICPVLRFKSPGKVSQILALMLPGPGESPITHQESFQFTTAVFPYDPEMLEVEGAFVLLWHNWIKHTNSMLASASAVEGI